MRIGFVGSNEIGVMNPDDALVAEALEKKGCNVDYICWDDPKQNWDQHNAYVNRCTWRYQNKYKDFIKWLSDCEISSIPLLNPPRLQTWNTNKNYLRDLSQGGISVVPTLFINRSDENNACLCVTEHRWDEIVCKPTIGASGFDVIKTDASNMHAVIKGLFAKNETIVIQPFMPEVLDGEWSLIFFKNQFSHAVFKKPGLNDFRVQQRWGGKSILAVPPPPLLSQATAILDYFGETSPLYTRIDGFWRKNAFILAELEVCEPYLWFNLHPPSADLFAKCCLDFCSRPAESNKMRV